jgi:hypothetical protein
VWWERTHKYIERLGVFLTMESWWLYLLEFIEIQGNIFTTRHTRAPSARRRSAWVPAAPLDPPAPAQSANGAQLTSSQRSNPLCGGVLRRALARAPAAACSGGGARSHAQVYPEPGTLDGWRSRCGFTLR